MDDEITSAPFNELASVDSVLDTGRAPTIGDFNELFDLKVYIPQSIVQPKKAKAIAMKKDTNYKTALKEMVNNWLKSWMAMMHTKAKSAFIVQDW